MVVCINCCRLHAGAAPNRPGRDSDSGRTRFVQVYEITKCNREFDHFVGIERIESHFVFESRDNDCKAQRVEAGLQQLQTIRKRHELALLLLRHLLEYRL